MAGPEDSRKDEFHLPIPERAHVKEAIELGKTLRTVFPSPVARFQELLDLLTDDEHEYVAHQIEKFKN